MKSNPSLRSYGDPCGIARALDVVGERWALLIVRELMFGPKRFTDLKEGLHGASPNVLSQRLHELDAAGVVRHVGGGGGAAAASWELTDRGRSLHPILVALGGWGARNTARPKGNLSVDALMVALETTFLPAHARAMSARYDLVLGAQQRFAVDIEAFDAGGVIRDAPTLAVTRGAHPRADAAIIAHDAATLRACIFGDLTVDDAVKHKKLELRGDAKLARAFFKLFARPK